jgi:hypothetical protein
MKDEDDDKEEDEEEVRSSGLNEARVTMKSAQNNT